MVRIALSTLFGNSKMTYKPPKKFKKGTHRHKLHKTLKSTLISGDLTAAVKVPKGESEDEWLAINCIDFYNMVNLLFGSITEFCDCSSMSAGDDDNPAEYLWMDEEQGIKKPIRCSAKQYVNYLMDWIARKVNNPAIFPSDPQDSFPTNFRSEIKTIFKRLFRVYAHIYSAHYNQIKQLGEIAHLNTSTSHFLMFCFEFNLISRKELNPMKNTITQLLPESEGFFEKRKKKRSTKSRSERS